MNAVDFVACSHCEGSGKCQCDGCQKTEFGTTYSSAGHYAVCSVCGGAGQVAVDTPYTDCGHCSGTGKCQCDACQKKFFGKTYSSDGHYCKCSVCNGSGKANIRYIPNS